MCKELDEIKEEAEKLKPEGLDRYSELRAELNDRRFEELLNRMRSLEASVDKMMNNHLKHMGEDIYSLALKVEKLNQLLADGADK
jgi:hypothetical protein